MGKLVWDTTLAMKEKHRASKDQEMLVKENNQVGYDQEDINKRESP